ncbi:MAG: YceD family protein [Bacillota bacterium]
MIQLDISRIKNNPGEEQRLVTNFRMEPIQSGHDRVFFNNPLRLDVFLVNDGGALKLGGFLEADVKVACSRCLELFDMPVRAEMDEVYYNESQQDVEPGEDWVPFRGDNLNITPEVEKALLSSLPMKLLCRQDCRGLCQKCGTNLNRGDCDCLVDNIDPRLEVLKKLLEKEN